MSQGTRKAVNAYSKVNHPGGKNITPKERERLIIEYSPLIRYVAGRIAMRLPSYLSLDDLIGAGALGLIDAVDKYDPNRNAKFKTYAEYRIRGSILDELRALDWVPRSIRRKSQEIESAHNDLINRLGREPEDDEVAQRLGLDLESYYGLVDETAGVGLFAIVDQKSNSDQFIPGTTMESVIAGLEESPDQKVDQNEIKRVIADAIEKLGLKEQLVISLYYYDELTMKEIGSVLDYTESRICQIHSKVMIKLRTRLRKYFEELA